MLVSIQHMNAGGLSSGVQPGKWQGRGVPAGPQPPQASALTSASLTTHCNMPAAVSREAMAASQGAVPLPPSACPCSLNQSPEDDCRWPAVDSCRVGVEGGGAGLGPQG